MTYPEHEKLERIQKESQAQGEFIDWLSGKGIYLAVYCDEKHLEALLVMANVSINNLLAEYHGINQAKLEQEKRQMLAEFRNERQDAVI